MPWVLALTDGMHGMVQAVAGGTCTAHLCRPACAPTPHVHTPPQANWDLYRAAKAGFALLGQEAKALPGPDPFRLSTPYHTSWSVRFKYGGHLRNLPGGPDLGGWGFLEGFLREPLKPTVAQLRKAFELVDMTVSRGCCALAPCVCTAVGNTLQSLFWQRWERGGSVV